MLCANILNRNFASNRELLRGANSPIKCFDSLQEFVICFEKRSSLRFLNRIEASFHFPRAALKARIECVCMRIYFSMLYAEIFSFSPFFRDQRWHLMMEHCKKRENHKWIKGHPLFLSSFPSK